MLAIINVVGFTCAVIIFGIITAVIMREMRFEKKHDEEYRKFLKDINNMSDKEFKRMRLMPRNYNRKG